jgi:hypothetical protein
MAGSAVEAAIGLFERRFVTNALLPVLLLPPAVAAPVLLQHNRIDVIAAAWDGQGAALKILEITGYLALVWFLAALVASQWRNLTRLFEGYPFERVGPLYRAAVEWHHERRRALAGDPVRRHLRYPRAHDRILPTGLGNILRAAEDYADDRYDAPFLTLWSRLYLVLPLEVQANIEWARGRMEFLLVVSAWGVAFAWLTLVLAYAFASAEVVVVICFLGGMTLAVAAYHSALFAAVEYGNRLRAAFELHRLKLLERMGLRSPKTLEEERDLWRAVNVFVVEERDEYRTPPLDWQRQWMYREPPPPELVLHLVLDPETPS